MHDCPRAIKGWEKGGVHQFCGRLCLLLNIICGALGLSLLVDHCAGNAIFSVAGLT